MKIYYAWWNPVKTLFFSVIQFVYRLLQYGAIYILSNTVWDGEGLSHFIAQQPQGRGGSNNIKNEVTPPKLEHKYSTQQVNLEVTPLS